MSKVTKPMMLDETGKALVEGQQRIVDALLNTESVRKAKEEITQLATDKKAEVVNAADEKIAEISVVGTRQVGDVLAQGTTEKTDISALGDSYIERIGTLGSNKVTDVEDKGNQKLAEINTATSSGVSQITTKGKQVMDSIPADYQTTVAKVDSLDNSVVKTNVAQSLSSDNKAQARANIDAVGQDEMANAIRMYQYDGALPTLCGQPPILFGEGTPQEAIVPINWIGLMDGGYAWTGLPSALGQQYININATTNGRYIAVRNGAHELKWLNF